VDKVLEKLADKFLNTAKEKKSSFPWSIILWALGFIVVGFLLYLSWKKNQEAAKLIHERNLQQEKAEQAKADLKVSTNAQEIKLLGIEISKLNLDVENRNAEIKKIEEETKRFEEKLNAAKDWDTINSAFGDK